MASDRSLVKYPYSSGYETSVVEGSEHESDTMDSGVIRGFEGMTREEILEQVGLYAEEKLNEIGAINYHGKLSTNGTLHQDW